MYPRFFRLSICLFSVLALSAFAFGDGGGDRTEFGHNITVGPQEQVTDATCFGCSIRVKGHVSGDLTTFGGNIVVEDGGQVDGDATTFAGNLHLEKSVAVRGDATVFGGRLDRDPEASIGGDVTHFGGGGWILLILAAPFIILGFLIAGAIWLIRRLLRPAPAAI